MCVAHDHCIGQNVSRLQSVLELSEKIRGDIRTIGYNLGSLEWQSEDLKQQTSYIFNTKTELIGTMLKEK